MPALAAKHVDQVLTDALAREQLSRDDITGWVLHAGGREILAAIRQRVGLSEEQTRWSAAILRGLLDEAGVPASGAVEPPPAAPTLF